MRNHTSEGNEVRIKGGREIMTYQPAPSAYLKWKAPISAMTRRCDTV
jgi:hypothetical protein